MTAALDFCFHDEQHCLDRTELPATSLHHLDVDLMEATVLVRTDF